MAKNSDSGDGRKQTSRDHGIHAVIDRIEDNGMAVVLLGDDENNR
jgi:hypothetical protein